MFLHSAQNKHPYLITFTSIKCTHFNYTLTLPKQKFTFSFAIVVFFIPLQQIVIYN